MTIRLADYFRRPLRLTPAEGLALLAAGRALLAVPGSDPEGPLATALAKLEAALELPGLVVDVGEPGQLDAVRDAVAHHERVEIDYWSAGRDELTTPADRPGCRLLRDSASGTSARTATAPTTSACSASTASAACAPTGETFEPEPTGFETGDVYTPRARRPAGHAASSRPTAAGSPEAYPTESVTERPDGALEVVLAVSEPAWLERLLLRLGPDAEVVDPPELRAAGAADAAQRYSSAIPKHLRATPVARGADLAPERVGRA